MNCQQQVKQRKFMGVRYRNCGEPVVALVGTARVPTCHAHECKFPPYVPREYLPREPQHDEGRK